MIFKGEEMKTNDSLNADTLNGLIHNIKQNIMNENMEKNSEFIKYLNLTQKFIGGLNEFDDKNIYENFILELSYFYVLCIIYSEYIYFRFKLKISYKFLADKIDINNIYKWFKIPENLEQIIQDKLEKRHLEFSGMNIITEFYESMLSTEEKRRIGQFYTPKNIVTYMLKDLQLNKLELDNEKKIIDPACGAGIFLAEITKLFSTRLKGIELAKYCNHNLYGNDINPFAVILTKFNISFEILSTIYNEDEVTEFLEKYAMFPNIALRNTITEQSNIKYNYIIGNPPYFKLKNTKFSNYKYYETIIYGQPNIYALFIYWALESADNDAKISFIIPQSFRSGLYFKKLREKLFNLKILSVTNFKSRSKVFKGVEQAVVILSLQNKRKRKNSKVKISHIQEIDIDNAYMYKAEQKSIMLNNDYDFFFFIPERNEMYNIIHKVYEGSTNLKKLNNNLLFGNGLYVWNQHKNLLTNEYSNGTAPIIYCNSIEKHKFNYKISFEKNNEKKLCSYIDETVDNFLLAGKRLIIQRTSTLSNPQRIKSCIISDEFLEKYPNYFLENHVNFLYNKLNKNINIDADELLFYEALLNSKVLNYIFKSKNGNTQVSATELNLLPIKERYKNEIIIKQKQFKIDKLKRTEEELEEIIFSNYAINGHEIDLINKCRGDMDWND